jgi:lysophospholipase L1-like esterase
VTEAPNPPTSAGRRVAATAALLAISLVVGGLVGESALRLLAAVGYPLAHRVATMDPYAVKVEPFGAFGYRQRPGARLQYSNGTLASANLQGFRGPDATVPKPAGTFRIVLLGESSTHGFDVNDDQTIDAYMRADLVAQRPGLHVEVVNLAYDGYDAYQMWQRLLVDGVPLQPDLIIANAGVNDVRNAHFAHLGDPDSRTLIWEADLRRLREEQARGGPTLWTRMKHFSYLARLPGVVRPMLEGPRRQPRVQQGPYPDAADNFKRNIERIADIAQRLGVPLVLSTPPSALLLADAPPMGPRSYWVGDPRTTQRYRDTLAARLRASAAKRSGEGQPVTYVAYHLPGRLFLDDVHLTPDGNQALAAHFVEAVMPLLPRRK